MTILQDKDFIMSRGVMVDCDEALPAEDQLFDGIEPVYDTPPQIHLDTM